MLTCRGRVRHQGRVTHVVAEHLTDLTFWLWRIGELDLGRLPNERGDVVRHGGGPDLRDARPRSAAGDGGPIIRPRNIFIPDLHIDGAAPNANEGAPTIRVRARDFR